MLVALSELCTGCQRCALICSYVHTGAFAPSRSRIWVIRARRRIDAPMVCSQCGLCIDACPVEALKRDPKTRAVVVDEERCTGCGFCAAACPWGVITLDPVTGKALKCDLCGGDPACVKECPENALRFLDVREAAGFRRSSIVKLVGE